MSGGAPSSSGSATSATTSSPWAPSSPYGQLYLQEMANTLFPGLANKGIPSLGIGASSNGSTLPSLPSMPADLNQSVAPFTSGQTTALQGINNITPTAMNLTGLGAGTLANFATGAQNNPSTNPELTAYYNAAAAPLVQNYQNAVAPSIMAQGAQTGSVGGTGYNQAFNTAEYNLGQSLGTTAANIFEPAFQAGQQLQYNAGAALPTAAMSLYSPLSAQYSAGAAQQTQSQNVLNTNYQNALAAEQFPFAMLSELGGAFGATAGAGGTTVGTQPIIGGSTGSKL